VRRLDSSESRTIGGRGRATFPADSLNPYYFPGANQERCHNKENYHERKKESEFLAVLALGVLC